MNFSEIPCPKGGFHTFDPLAPEKRCFKCDKVLIIPQKKQIEFLKSPANIVIFGGAKGCAKSYSLLLETTRHVTNPRFGAVVFRRESTQIFGQGGLWDTSQLIYPHLGGEAFRYRSEWLFPSGAKIKFAHLAMERDVNAWDGQQVPLICFDELTLFTEKQFWYMLTINRSTCGVQPYMRASCNPDSDSWVADVISWWIDQDTGLPIADRGGKLRWFVREGGELVWADSRAELVRQFPRQLPKSLTFIPAKLEDNPILERADPGYRANLLSQETVTKQRLLDGNWKVRPAAGLKFPRDKWRRYDAPPKDLRLVRFWDKAGTEGGKGARTAGILMGDLGEARARESALPQFWVVHGEVDRWGDAERESKIKSLAALDQQVYGHVTIGMEREGGSGGKHSAFVTVTNLAGYDVYSEPATTNKAARWTPLATQQQVGNVAIVCDNTWDWAGFIRELDALAGDAELDKAKLKDQADAAAGAFKYLAPGGGGTSIQGDLIASEDQFEPLTTEDKAGMPDFLRELIGDADGAQDDGLEMPWGRD